MVILPVNPRKPVPECLHSRFFGAKDDGGGGENWSYKTRTAPVKSSPCSLLRARCSSCRPTNDVKALTGKLLSLLLICIDRLLFYYSLFLTYTP